MKNYLLFTGDIYYASGGFYDAHSDHETLDEAIDKAKILTEDDLIRWAHVVDISQGKIIFEQERAYF